MDTVVYRGGILGQNMLGPISPLTEPPSSDITSLSASLAYSSEHLRTLAMRTILAGLGPL